MEGEGLVLALVAVREARCHRHRASRRFVVSSFRVLAVVALWWRVFVVACCWRVVVACPRFVVALLLSCIVSSSARSFRRLMARSLGVLVRYVGTSMGWTHQTKRRTMTNVVVRRLVRLPHHCRRRGTPFAFIGGRSGSWVAVGVCGQLVSL